VSIALGSLGELDTLLELSHRLGFLTLGELQRVSGLAALVGRLLNGLYASLERKLSTAVHVEQPARRGEQEYSTRAGRSRAASSM